MKYFEFLEFDNLKEKEVFLDIDGTITEDKSESVSDEIKNKINQLKNIAHKVILLSNGPEDRTVKMSEFLNLEYHLSDYKKPNKKVLENLDLKKAVLLGDKFLTDGLTAVQNKIPFIHVKSIKGGKDGSAVKSLYYLDDILGNIYELIRLIRPKQWLKNGLVFAPLFFAGEFLNLFSVANAFVAFLIFSLTASIVYIINDYKDISKDKLHNKKMWRPLAQGSISYVYVFIFLALLIVLLTLSLSYLYVLIPVIFTYLASNIIYTYWFKNVPVLDTVLVAFMYVLRVVAGGVAVPVFVSPWIIICTFFSSLFIITAKRYAEFENPVRSVLRFYTKESLTAMLIGSATLSVISYTLYTILSSTNNLIMYSSIIVTAVFFIILNDILRGEAKIETPEIYLITNRKINFLILIWLALFAYILYFH